MTYKIREVDGTDDEIADILTELHKLTFFNEASIPAFDQGHWWMGYCGKEPISFASLIPSDRYPRAGYFKRVGVLPAHRGRGLQLRHMRALENRARRNGWTQIVSDTTSNPHSANNFISAGYWILAPDYPWAFPHSVYWVKEIR
jgi:GNAT superfamily N-acetyltransferase